MFRHSRDFFLSHLAPKRAVEPGSEPVSSAPINLAQFKYAISRAEIPIDDIKIDHLKTIERFLKENPEENINHILLTFTDHRNITWLLTPLCYAITQLNTSAIEKLLQLGAHIEQTIKNQHYKIYEPELLTPLALIISTLNWRNIYHSSALKVIKLLQKNGANILSPSVVYYSAINNHKDIFDQVLDLDIFSNKKFGCSYTEFLYLIFDNLVSTTDQDHESNQCKQLIEKLIKAGASVNEVIVYHSSFQLLLAHTTRKPHANDTIYVITEFLLAHPMTNLDIPSHKEMIRTSLMEILIVLTESRVLIRNVQTSFMLALIKAGADVNFQLYNFTPLSLALSKLSTDVTIGLVQQLLTIPHINLHIKCGLHNPISVYDLAITDQIKPAFYNLKTNIIKVHQQQIMPIVKIINEDKHNSCSYFSTIPNDVLQYILQPMLFGPNNNSASPNLQLENQIRFSEPSESTELIARAEPDYPESLTPARKYRAI